VSPAALRRGGADSDDDENEGKGDAGGAAEAVNPCGRRSHIRDSTPRRTTGLAAAPIARARGSPVRAPFVYSLRVPVILVRHPLVQDILLSLRDVATAAGRVQAPRREDQRPAGR